jgi:hypothetical protein
MATTLTPTQRYSAGALLALALRQAQIHQSVPLGGGSADDEERASSASGGSSASTATSSASGSDAAADADLWTHDSRGLLRPVFRCAAPPRRDERARSTSDQYSRSLPAMLGSWRSNPRRGLAWRRPPRRPRPSITSARYALHSHPDRVLT